MLTAQDDLIGHQTPQPFAKAGGGDIRFTERYWYTAHPIDGSELLIDIGLGYYPNRNVMDGFAGITIGRRQHNFRASRRLGTRPLEGMGVNGLLTGTFWYNPGTFSTGDCLWDVSSTWKVREKIERD